MILIRPNGLVERLDGWPRVGGVLAPYGREQAGPRTAETVRVGARQDRRGQRRVKPDPLRGRLVDIRT